MVDSPDKTAFGAAHVYTMVDSPGKTAFGAAQVYTMVDSPGKTAFSCRTIQVVRIVQALQVRRHKGVRCYHMILQYRTVPGRLRKKDNFVFLFRSDQLRSPVLYFYCNAKRGNK